MEYIIKTKDLNKIYSLGNGAWLKASDNISIEIPKGKLTIFKGRSGSGKTTLMNCISALDTPTSGEIEFMGLNMEKLNNGEKEKLRRNHMGFVFQSVALIPAMTAYENVEFALRLVEGGKAYKKAEDKKQRITEVLEQVGLAERKDHMAGRLSGGEQQRVAIARAIVNNPDVIFADEPTGALDTATGLSVMKLFKKLTAEGLTIVMTTHDPNLMELADVVFELEDGHVVK